MLKCSKCSATRSAQFYFIALPQFLYCPPCLAVIAARVKGPLRIGLRNFKHMQRNRYYVNQWLAQPALVEDKPRNLFEGL